VRIKNDNLNIRHAPRVVGAFTGKRGRAVSSNPEKMGDSGPKWTGGLKDTSITMGVTTETHEKRLGGANPHQPGSMDYMSMDPHLITSSVPLKYGVAKASDYQSATSGGEPRMALGSHRVIAGTGRAVQKKTDGTQDIISKLSSLVAKQRENTTSQSEKGEPIV
jgi:hypothetical protein